MKAFFAKVWNATKGAFSKAWAWSIGHKAIAIAVAATVVVGTTCAIALPIALHNHKFAEEWCTDAENHWHSATCKHEEEKSDLAAHTFDNDCDAKCDVCGYERTAGAHTYDNACDTTCNTCGATRTVDPHAYDNACDTACNNCGATRQITHTYNVESATTATLKAEANADKKAQYWKSCACGAISTTEYFETGKIMGAITDIQNLSKTYDAEIVDIPTYVTNSTGAVTIEWYRISGMELSGAPKNSGAYKVKITIAETETHTGVSKEKEFVIGMAQATLTNVAVSPVTVKYGDNYYITHTTEGDGAVTVEYKMHGASDETYTTEKPTNVGEYTARVTLADGTNYLGTSATVDFEIEQFVLAGLDSLYTQFVYNGKAVHEIDLSAEGYTGVTVEVTFEDADAGSAVTAVKVLEYGDETENYVLDVENCGTTIISRVVEIEWIAPENLRFDGTKKVPSAVLTNVVPGDECKLDLMIDGIDGKDNVWYGSTFTYFFDIVGADVDNANYALPDDIYSPEYTIEIDETAEVGDAVSVGSVWYYDEVDHCTMYYSINLTANYYYFVYESDNQGVSFVFELYAKGDTANPIATWEVDENSVKSGMFLIETDGEYYVKAVSYNEPQYETLTIQVHTEHTSIDAYGFCSECLAYCGEELTTNCPTTVTVKKTQPSYLRFADDPEDPSVQFSLKYIGEHANITVKCYAAASNGAFVEQTLDSTPGTLQTSTDGYYYLVFTFDSQVNIPKDITIHVEQTY